jgi:hypothetical protein
VIIGRSPGCTSWYEDYDWSSQTLNYDDSEATFDPVDSFCCLMISELSIPEVCCY